MVRTKIVATLGPASSSEQAIGALIQAGVDVFRLNMAHGTVAEHQEMLDRIRRMSDELVRPVGGLVDLAGPKIRLGELPGGGDRMCRGNAGPICPREWGIDPRHLHDHLRPARRRARAG